MFFAEGYNQFIPNSGGENQIIKGTLNRHMITPSTPFNAIRNNWDNSLASPVYDYDYKLNSSEAGYYGDETYIEDLDPVDYSAECILTPCTSCTPEDLNPFINCSDCSIISTTNFDDIDLNNAIADALNDEPVDAFGKLKEILTDNLSSISENDRFLLKYAYRKMKDYYASFLSDTNYVALNEIPNIENYTDDLTDVMDYQMQVVLPDQLFEDTSIIKLDKALLLKTFEELTTASTMISEIEMVIDTVKDNYMTYWQCLISAEKDLNDELIGEGDFYEAILYCLETSIAGVGNRAFMTYPNNTYYSRVKPSNKGNNNPITAVQEVSIYPNPFSGQFKIVLPFVSNNCRIIITDLYGRRIKEYSVNNINEVIVDLSEISDGYYNCKIIADESQFLEKVLKIKQ